VFFVTQNPLDVPDTVLAQLGSRVQHALRAFTAKDQKAVKAAADTMRPNPAFDASQAITELEVGEALISLLDAKARPQIVQRAFVLPPASRIGPLTAGERAQVMTDSLVAGVYDTAIDRESAYEKLKGTAEAAASAPAQEGGWAERMKDMAGEALGSKGGRGDSVVQALAKSAARSIGSTLGREILRGVLGSIMRRR
jgi:hypothetical protein